MCEREKERARERERDRDGAHRKGVDEVVVPREGPEHESARGVQRVAGQIQRPFEGWSRIQGRGLPQEVMRLLKVTTPFSKVNLPRENCLQAICATIVVTFHADFWGSKRSLVHRMGPVQS